ncbi:MAG: helix-turn-helix domain-containing protein [Bacteroidales bacterium]|nr:helix-turn-helix domain-containing protein [Bacteroidales bacterium]
MKKDDHLKYLYIGAMIKEVARRKGVSSGTLAHLIGKYMENVSEIYKLDDMDSEDVVKISYLLEYNLLEIISKKYLPHLPFTGHSPNQESYCMNLDIKTGVISANRNIGNCIFLKKIHIGQYIRKIAKKNGWNTQEDMAELLQCSQSNVSYLYKQKSLKLTTLIHLSEVLQYNFIAEVYLSQMFSNPVSDIFSCSTVTSFSQQI